MKRVYLAGPDVFREDAVGHFRTLKAACGRRGLLGVAPFDAVPQGSPNAKGLAAEIRDDNLGLLRSCHAVLANVTPFRGPHADDGTAFEVGYATALGKPVFCYSDQLYFSGTTKVKDLVSRVPCSGRPCGPFFDADGWLVEDFGLPVNLMLVNEHGVSGSFEEAVRKCAESLA